MREIYQQIHLDSEAVIEINEHPAYPGTDVKKESLVKIYMQTMIGYYAVVVDLKNQIVTVCPDLKGWKVIREEVPHPD